MRKRIKKILSTLIAFAVIATLSLGVLAADTTVTGTGSVTGTVGINGSISPVTISVTHPLTVAYSIDPNTGATGTFITPDIAIVNNTKVAITVTVSSLTAASGGTLTFTDTDTASKTWATLNLADSKKYIALGVKAKDATGWTTGYSTLTHWAVKATPSLIGTLNPTITGKLNFTANYGLAFDVAYTANHNIIFIFQLA